MNKKNRYYTSVIQNKGLILVRGIENGRQFQERIRYKPYLFINGQGETPYKTIYQEPVHRIDFDSMSEAREYINMYKDVANHTIYGMTNFIYPFIYDNFPGTIEYNPEEISKVCIDIENKIGQETMADSIRFTPNEITAITLSKDDKYISFGCKDYTPEASNVKYIKCKDEVDLLLKFIDVWKKLNPDIITGYNITLYDIPYLVGRITRVLGESKARELSPWNLISKRTVEIKGSKVEIFELEGVSQLDYYDLYKKFTGTSRESYRLDYIAQYEIGAQKLDYSEYANLNELYEKDFQKFLSYNIHDVRLVWQLDEKMKLIDLALAMAYDAKVNYNDIMTTVRQWDVMIHNYLLDQNIVVNPDKVGHGADSIVGGYVKDTPPGRYKWIVSFDFNSLYPSMIQHINISPDVYYDKDYLKKVVEKEMNRRNLINKAN